VDGEDKIMTPLVWREIIYPTLFSAGPVLAIECEKQFCIVMDRLDDVEFDKMYERRLEAKKSFALQMGNQLKAVHKADFAFLDFAADNIMKKDGKFVLIDWGGARSSLDIMRNISIVGKSGNFFPGADALTGKRGLVDGIKAYKQFEHLLGDFKWCVHWIDEHGVQKKGEIGRVDLGGAKKNNSEGITTTTTTVLVFEMGTESRAELFRIIKTKDDASRDPTTIVKNLHDQEVKGPKLKELQISPPGIKFYQRFYDDYAFLSVLKLVFFGPKNDSVLPELTAEEIQFMESIKTMIDEGMENPGTFKMDALIDLVEPSRDIVDALIALVGSLSEEEDAE